jgi:outer membrane protein assembly factor BamB
MEQKNDTVASSPAIAEDGIIYVGVMGPGWNKGRVYAVNPNGTEKWHYDTGFWIKSSPAIGNDGTVYIGSGDDKLYAIYPNGTMKWKYETGDYIQSSLAIDDNGTIYVGSWDGYLYAIYPNGTMKWKVKTGLIDDSSPAIGKDGTIYVASYYGKLYAIYPNGTKKWSFKMGDETFSSPAISNDETIYIGSCDENLYAINPDGTERWNLPFGTCGSSPAIGNDGTIYVGGSDLYAIKIIENYPPEKPKKPSGPTEGEVGENYTFSTYTTDPDGDRVYYMWDWGDGSNSGWLGSFNSGEVAKASHSWVDGGTHEIKVKAKDIWNSTNSESDWSDSLHIRLSGPNIEIGFIWGGLGVKAMIWNIGSDTAYDVPWEITIHSDFGGKIGSESGTIAKIKVWRAKTVRALNMSWLEYFPIPDYVKITVKASTETKIMHGYMLGPFFFIDRSK